MIDLPRVPIKHLLLKIDVVIIAERVRNDKCTDVTKFQRSSLTGGRILMKKMCKIVKDGNLPENDQFLELIEKAKYFCNRCGRVANKKKALCEPENVKRESA